LTNVPAYAVELKDKDLSLLYKIKEYFGVGKVQMVKNKGISFLLNH